MRPGAQTGTGDILEGRAKGGLALKRGILGLPFPPHNSPPCSANLPSALWAACCAFRAEVWTQGDTEVLLERSLGAGRGLQGGLDPRAGPKPRTPRSLTC